MTAAVPVRRPPVLRLVVGVVAVVGWFVGTTVLGFAGAALFPVTLAAAVVLVPLGTAYGAVLRTILGVRRRRALLRGAAATGDAAVRAARFGSRAQQGDRLLSIGLLVTAVPAGLLAVVQLVPAVRDALSADDGTRPVLESTTFLAAGIATELLLAIPIAAVLVTRQVVSTPLLVGEAAALAAGSGASRRIRTTRALSWTAYGVWTAVALAVIWAVLAGRLLG